MFTMKKFLATTLALSMMVGASAMPSYAITKDEFEMGVEYQLVSKEYSFTDLEAVFNSSNEIGFFHSVFSPKAEVLVNGADETFSLTIYVANDEDLGYSTINETSDRFPNEGDCHLTEGLFPIAYISYNDVNYYADVVSGLYNSTAPEVTFTKSTADCQGFGSVVGVNIVAGQSYTCDVVTFKNIPLEALEEDLLNGYFGVNGKWQDSLSTTSFYEFYDFDLGIDFEYEVVPDDNEVPETPLEPIVEEKQVTISATKSVATAPAPDYEITIPETVVVPDLVAGQDASVQYSVTVDLKDTKSVTVSSCTEGVLTSSDGGELPFTNSFTTETCTEGGLKYGKVTISAEDIAKATAGAYAGNVTFQFSFETE